MRLRGSIRRLPAARPAPPPRAVPAAGLALLLAAGLCLAGPGTAQEAADEPDAPAANEGAGKPKPKPRLPAPRAAKPAAKPDAKPEAKSAPAAPAAAWPAGASALSETYGDWTLNCARSEAQTPVQVSCLVTQSQGNKQTGRREFAIELRTPREGRAEGVVLMPFGLAIEPGVTFKLDEAVLGKGAPYSSCTGEGCLVPISFPTLATDAMKTAKALAVLGQKAGGTDPVTLTVPLTGFVTAFERAVALAG